MIAYALAKAPTGQNRISKQKELFVHDTPTRSAFCEWRAHVFSLTALCVMLGAFVLLALTGPLGTDVRLTHLPRFGYWLVIVVLTDATGSLFTTLIAFQWRFQSQITMSGLS